MSRSASRPSTTRGNARAARWPGWAALLLGAAWAVLAHAPASWIASTVAGASAHRLLLCDSRGDWLDGSARVVLSAGVQGRSASVLPGTLHWHIGLRQLWRGALQLRLSWPGLAEQPLRLQAHAGIGGWSLQQSGAQPWQASLPAVLLQGLGTPWNTLAPRGLVRLDLHGARLRSSAGRLDVAGTLRVDALAMSSRLSTVSPLGSYRLLLQGAGATTAVSLRTLSGSLLLSGDGVWNGDRLQFSGIARAAAGREQELATLLGLLGQPQGDHVRIAL